MKMNKISPAKKPRIAKNNPPRFSFFSIREILITPVTMAIPEKTIPNMKRLDIAEKKDKSQNSYVFSKRLRKYFWLT